FVEEACSGLSMLIVFFALATALALMVRRPLLDRVVVVASAVLIALVANVTRITSTGMLMQAGWSRQANLVFHDLAGWLMMAQALALLGAEMWVLGRLLIPADPARPPLPVSRPLLREAPPGGRPRGGPHR